MTDINTMPLAGVRVIDFTQVMMGPVATQMLADYGADVIKIEKPGTGDLSRTSFPDDPAGLVRYCWGDAPLCNLYDGADLPAGPFEIAVQ